MLIITLFIFVDTQRNSIQKSNYGIILLLFIILYMGLRPVSGQYFGDMGVYSRYFSDYKSGLPVIANKDLLFHYFMKFCSYFMNVSTFFVVCASLYIIPMYIISKKWFKDYWFYAFLMLVASFSFWAYGTNGIRNGIATSFFLLAISRDKRIFQILWLLIAVGFHKTLLLPVAGFVITWFYNLPKGFFIFWLATIPLSLIFPGFWENFFADFITDERSGFFTDGNVNEDSFSSVGFRWDFLLYSATGVFAGWYYIFKLGLKDKIYIQLFNTFLFANAFWILVIRANFSNRFAYLSWFLLALVIVYPWIKKYISANQFVTLGWIILAYFGFTFFMYFIFYG